MPHSLVLNSGLTGGHKAVGENVFLADLPCRYPCYAFYYPGPVAAPELESGLRTLGEQAGENLFVNLGRLNDPAYRKVANLFKIKRTPVIIITAIAPLAAPEGVDLNAYVRLDSARLLAVPGRTIQCVNEVFTLFLRGEIGKAVRTGQWKTHSELIRVLASRVTSALNAAWDFMLDRDLSVSVLEGRFELKRSAQ